MRIKLFAGAMLAVTAMGAQAASDAPSGYTKCVKNTGATCSMSGTRSVALGKSGSFVYATKTGSFACSGSAFPSNSFTTSAWCSYGATTTASSSSASSAASSSAASSSVAASSSSSAAASGSVNLGASATSSAIVLNWSSSGTNLTSVQIYRDTDSNPSGRSKLASLATSDSSYTDSTAAAGTTYYYWVKFVSNGITANSNAASAMIPVASSSSSSAASGSISLGASVSGSSVALKWSVSGLNLSSQEIYRDTDSNPSGRTKLAAVSTSTTSYTDSTAAAGTTYYYWVKYVAGGVTSNSNAASVTLPSASSSSSSTSSSASADPYVTGCGTETSNLKASKVYYVTPSGSASGAGTSFSSPMSFSAALSKVTAGQMVLLQPGTYKVAYTAGAKNTIVLSKSGSSSSKIYMVAANCGKAIIDFQFPDTAWVQDSFGFSLTGSYWYFKGIEITRAGYQGVYVTGGYNTFENVAFHHNRNSGLEINKGGHHTSVINSDSYRNYDPKKNGSMADGFASKQTQGAGNFFYGCRSWENSDDGWDTFDSTQPVVIENSWTFRNGINYWNDASFAGNGNGFKLGGNNKLEHNKITNSVSFGHPNKGFDQNSNTGGVTVLNNTSFSNGINYGFGQPVASGEKHTFRNNISLSGKAADNVANANASNNTWNGIAVSSADFLSVDTNLATRTRNPDGSLVYTTLFRLAPGSKQINAGVDVGLPYLGSKPDLGAFERE